jgi:hypothetical protein
MQSLRKYNTTIRYHYGLRYTDLEPQFYGPGKGKPYLNVPTYTNVDQAASSANDLGQDRSKTLCLVEKVNDKDDVNFMPVWKQRLHGCTPYFSMVAMMAYWSYFGYRIFCTRAAEKKAHRKFGMAWTFIAVELGVASKFFSHTQATCSLF